MNLILVILTILFKCSLCRDYYVGMFKKNDILVAQDTLYKEKNYFGFTTAKYGRVFHCPITYFRVSDRLGVGRPPTVTVTRGGLQKKYITLLLTSSYNTPVAVNIYIGCEKKLTTKTTTATNEKTGEKEGTTVLGENATGDDAEATTVATDGENAEEAVEDAEDAEAEEGEEAVDEEAADEGEGEDGKK